MADKQASDEAGGSVSVALVSTGGCASRDVVLEHYRYLRERFTHKGDRLWLRFYYFLTIEAALFTAFVKVRETESLYSMRPLILVLGISWTALWFVIAAQDLWFFEQSRKRLDDFIVSHITPSLTPWDNWKLYPTRKLKKLICFKIPHCGVTTFSVICSLFVGLMWSLLWLVR